MGHEGTCRIGRRVVVGLEPPDCGIDKVVPLATSRRGARNATEAPYRAGYSGQAPVEAPAGLCHVAGLPVLAALRQRTENMYSDVSLFIDGKWGPASGGRTIAVANPATGDSIGTVPHAAISDLDRALEAADKGFKAWRKMSAFDRSKVMRKAGDILRERADKIATLMTMEQGKPVGEAKMEVLAGADVIDWFAEEARRAYGRVIPARAEGVYQLVIKEPVGP